MSLQLHHNFFLNGRVVAKFWPLDIITDADVLRKNLKVLAVWNNETNSKHFAAVRIETQIVDE